MALVNCPECGRKVSDQADSCPACGRRLSDRLTKVELEAEMNRIELEWEKERRKHMIRRIGHLDLVVPTKTDTVIKMVVFGLVIVGLFGGFIVALPGGNGVAYQLVLFILLPLLALDFGLGLNHFLKAAAYEKAEAAYQQRRDAAEAKYEVEARTRSDEPSSQRSQPG